MQASDSINVYSLDRQAARRSFERASPSYAEAAVLQAQVRNELLERLDVFALEPHVVLDLGAGPGEGAQALSRKYPKARVIAVDMALGMLREARSSEVDQMLSAPLEYLCADAQHLPLKDASVDLIFSSLMLQWCEPLDAVLAELTRVLKPTGFFAFSTFGPDTLIELRSAWAAVDTHTHVNAFIDMHNVGDALLHAGFSEPVLDVERIELAYPDTLSLMRELKAIGAHNVTAGRPRGLMGKQRFERMTQAYESLRHESGLPATYEVIYGATWGGTPRSNIRGREDEVLVPLSALRRR